jgi:hypothetical protein
MSYPSVRLGRGGDGSVDADLERSKRAYATRGGVEDATRALTATLRARGPDAACAWVRREVGDERLRLLREETERLQRALERAAADADPDLCGEEGMRALAGLVGFLATLDRVAHDEWPDGTCPGVVATALDAWRRLVPLALTERLVSGALFLAGTAGHDGQRRVDQVRLSFQRRVALAMSLLASHVPPTRRRA